ncbi:4081_t:CDS:2, partial [Ambispora leptoticha]
SLSTDLCSLLEEADDFNVLIKVGQDPNVREFKAHSVLLRARSAYFRRALSRDWAKMEGNCIVFNKSNISSDVFEVILNYLYTGTITLSGQDADWLLDLLMAVDELCLKELLDFVQDQLVQNQSNWLKVNFKKIYEMAFNHPALTTLQDHCRQIICDDPESIFKPDMLQLLDENVLLSILQRDDLNLTEIRTWESIINWGIAQNPRLNSEDLEKWTPEDFATLATTLERCIPLVRYLQIPPAD